MQPNQDLRTEAGVVVGGYELVRRLGKGGMAEVWVARKALGAKGSKFVAIKLIADHHIGDERYTRMFRSEAELAAMLSHANIVQVFDEGEDEGRSYLIMEWVDGLNLLKLGAVLALLDDDERRFRVTAYIIGQLLHALHYAHSITSADGHPLGVVHRDVSPQNVLVSNHGEVKLTDFGVAYYNVEQSSGIHVKGKVRYMSPEQIGGKTRSATVDLFAVGALLHELLDGRKFRGEYEDGQDLFTAVINGEVPPLSRSIPPELDELRVRLLAPDPAERIQTAEEALEWLQRYPGYGDARAELTKLCSSLTGVVKPRAGPGLVSQAPATAQVGGNKKLAKPLVNPESSRPGKPAVPPAPPMGMAANTGTMFESPRHSGTPAALITGKTEFIDPHHLRPGKKQGGGGMAARPPAPPSTENLAHMMARGSAAAMAVEPLAQPAIPYPTANPFPQPVADQRSHPIPIAIPVSPPVAPTELFNVSDVSGLATEAIDVSAFAEPVSNSATDIAPMGWLRDGTDASREIRPQGMPPSPSMAIAVPKRSAPIAMLVVGLLLVAVASVSVTWWLFTRNKEARLAAEASAAVASTTAPAETPKSSASGSTEMKEAELPEPPPKPLVILPQAEGEQSDEGSNESVHSENAGSDGTSADPTPAPERVPASVDPPKPKATVIVTALPSIPNGAQVRLGGSYTFTIKKGVTLTKKLVAGKKKVEWRTDANAQWKPAAAIVLEPRKTTRIQLMVTGPRVSPG